VNTTQHGHGEDEGSSAAWDFGDNPGPESGDDFGQESGSFLDFGDGVGHDSAEPSLIDSLVGSEPAPLADAGGELIDALAENDGDLAGTEDDEIIVPSATVTNPPETVTVTATMDGKISRVELSADAAKMTESGLAEEIFVIADLARQRALSLQHSLVLDAFRHMGISDKEDEDFVVEALETGVTELRSPDQAVQAQAEVFAARYASSEDAR
jgi:hypothetical protein